MSFDSGLSKLHESNSGGQRSELPWWENCVLTMVFDMQKKKIYYAPYGGGGGAKQDKKLQKENFLQRFAQVGFK